MTTVSHRLLLRLLDFIWPGNYARHHAVALYQSYLATKRVEDLKSAIKYFEEAVVKYRKRRGSRLVTTLINAAVAVRKHHDLTNSAEDLEKSFDLATEAQNQWVGEKESKAYTILLDILASAYAHQYHTALTNGAGVSSTWSQKDKAFDNAVKLYTELIDNSAAWSQRSDTQIRLGTFFRMRCELERTPTRFEMGIFYLKEALSEAENLVTKAICLFNLADSYEVLYEVLYEVDGEPNLCALDHAISYNTRAKAVTEELGRGSLEYTVCLFNLARQYYTRWAQTREQDDHDSAKLLTQEAKGYYNVIEGTPLMTQITALSDALLQADGGQRNTTQEESMGSILTEPQSGGSINKVHDINRYDESDPKMPAVQTNIWSGDDDRDDARAAFNSYLASGKAEDLDTAVASFKLAVYDYRNRQHPSLVTTLINYAGAVRRRYDDFTQSVDDLNVVVSLATEARNNWSGETASAPYVALIKILADAHLEQYYRSVTASSGGSVEPNWDAFDTAVELYTELKENVAAADQRADTQIHLGIMFRKRFELDKTTWRIEIGVRNLHKALTEATKDPEVRVRCLIGLAESYEAMYQVVNESMRSMHDLDMAINHYNIAIMHLQELGSGRRELPVCRYNVARQVRLRLAETGDVLDWSNAMAMSMAAKASEGVDEALMKDIIKLLDSLQLKDQETEVELIEEIELVEMDGVIPPRHSFIIPRRRDHVLIMED